VSDPKWKCKSDDDVDKINRATKLTIAGYRVKMVHLCFMGTRLADVAYITGDPQSWDEFSGRSTHKSIMASVPPGYPSPLIRICTQVTNVYIT
jgi:hypothetical protein